MLNSILQLNNKVSNALLKSRPLLFSYGKVQFDGSVMSKRKIKKLIDDKIISGWDDPRLFTIRGLFNRGMHVTALQQYIAKLGFSKNGNNTKRTDDNLSTINKKIVDKIATRYFALPSDRTVSCNIENYYEHIKAYTQNVPRFIRNPDLKDRTLHFDQNILIEHFDYQNGEEITLMNWKNVVVNQHDAYPYDLILNINPNGDFKTTAKKAVWIANKNTVNLVVKSYGGLDDPIVETRLIGEEAIFEIGVGDYIQLMKMNYYKCTGKDDNTRTVYLVELN